MASGLAPATMKRLMKEFAGIAAAPMEGVMLLTNEDDMTCVQALIEGPVDTPYEGGIFRVSLKLGNDFPMAPPKGIFVTKIFHPNVSASGEICVNTLKRDWSPTLGIKHILITIKCLLIVPNPDSALNDEAGKMLSDRYEDYCTRAASWTSIHASSKKDRDLFARHRTAFAAANASTSSTSSTAAAAVAANTNTDTDIKVDGAAADAARSGSSLTIDDAPTNDSANADASSVLVNGDGADTETNGEGAIDKENNKSNEPIAAARLAAQSDIPAAKKPKSVASATPATAAAAKKKLNRRL